MMMMRSCTLASCKTNPTLFSSSEIKAGVAECIIATMLHYHLTHYCLEKLSEKLEYLNEVSTMNVRKASVLDIRFSFSNSSVISGNSDAHLRGTTYLGLISTDWP
ncbi:unnamed protein product [Amaranthus hypochondriacus]